MNLASTIYVTSSNFALYKHIRLRDLFNDFIFTMQTTCLVLLTPFVETIEHRAMAGWALLILAVFAFSVNATLCIKIAVKWFGLVIVLIYKRIRFSYRKW